MTDIIKSKNNVPVTYRDMSDGTYAEVAAQGSNFIKKFRDAFEGFNPNTPESPWAATINPFDVVNIEGNCLGASYLSISRDPLGRDTDTETVIETVDSFQMPFEASVGLHSSQRVVGQDFYVEMVDTDDTLPAFSPVTISSISQSTTTLTIITSAPHGFTVGQRFSVYDVSDSRLNYPSLVVATVPTATQFTATAGPVGTIPSLTIGPFANGSVIGKSALGRRRNGTSMCFENSSATAASFFIRSESGEVYPSGTGASNHSLPITTSASAQLVNAVGAYAFAPSTEYRLSMQADRVTWTDLPMDGVVGSNTRLSRSQVIPSIDKKYKLRFRFTSAKSLTRPVGGKIVSATKSGSTTATIVTNEAHGLTTDDIICVYGILDQTNFANQTAAVAVASVIDAFTFTVVFGASATATSFGGVVANVNGNTLPSGLGYTTQTIINATMASGVFSVTGSGSWSNLLIGDIVELVGCDVSSGTSQGIDGAWRVRSIVTNQLTLEWVAVSGVPADFGAIAVSGAVIKRTSMRISFARIFDYERQRVELLPRGNGDVTGSLPVNVTNNGGTLTIAGQAAHDAGISGSPVRIGARASSANYPAVASGDAADWVSTRVGALTIKPFAIPEAGFNASLSLTTTTAVAIASAAGAGIKRHLTACQVINTGAAAVDLIILDGSTERWRLTLPVNIPVSFEFPTEIITTGDTALNANLSAAGTVRANFQGYTAP